MHLLVEYGIQKNRKFISPETNGIPHQTELSVFSVISSLRLALLNCVIAGYAVMYKIINCISH